jgi:hypothetical protein
MNSTRAALALGALFFLSSCSPLSTAPRDGFSWLLGKRWSIALELGSRFDSYNTVIREREVQFEGVPQPAQTAVNRNNSFILAGTIISFAPSDRVTQVQYLETEAAGLSFLIWSARVNGSELLSLDMYASPADTDVDLNLASSCLFRRWDDPNGGALGEYQEFVPTRSGDQSFTRRLMGDCRLTRLP